MTSRIQPNYNTGNDMSELNSQEKSSKASRYLSETFKTLIGVIAIAVVVATIFTAATPVSLMTEDVSNILAEAISFSEATPTPEWPTPTPRPRPRIGIVVGHWGDNNDPGAVCSDGLTELQVNQEVATRVQHSLTAEGYDVDLLKEFDPLLQDYKALALVSIHADSCTYVNDQATGYKVAPSMENRRPERTKRLTSCLRYRYEESTGLNSHNSVTADMSSYHAFDEINIDTPAVIIEIGFLNLDRQILTQEPGRIAAGITDGILCYIRNENIP
jgi:N-acetylmuramoyl-L-alanine amidase